MRSLVLACLLAGCAPGYDDIADKLQVETQQKIDEGLIRLEGDRAVIDGAAAAAATTAQAQAAGTDASFAANIGFYAGALADLATLQSRIQSAGDASAPKVAADVSSIAANVTLIRDKHAREGKLGADYVKLMKDTIDQQFIPLNLYQLQLKGGSKPG